MDPQELLDTAEAVTIGVMLYFGMQDIHGKHPIWVAGTILLIVLHVHEDDPRILRLIEGVLIVSIPVAYIIFGVDAAFLVCIVLFAWNAIDVAYHILDKLREVKKSLLTAIQPQP